MKDIIKDIVIVGLILIGIIFTLAYVNSPEEIEQTSRNECEYKYRINDLSDKTCDYSLIKKEMLEELGTYINY